MKRWIKVEIEVDKDGNCDCCPVRFVNPEEGYAFCPVDDTLGHTRLDACIAADVTDIVAENEKLEKVLQDYLDDEQKIHKLVSPYIPDILSESGQKTLPMITGELVAELAMYKRAMELLDREWENAYSARVRNCYTIKYFVEKARAEQEVE